jgi:hypothetical protein
MWYADAAFAVHKDMRSHTGGLITLDKGEVQTISLKQKINIKSSTEAEFVAADDVVFQILWMKWFMEEQGYGIMETLLYQDN